MLILFSIDFQSWMVRLRGIHTWAWRYQSWAIPATLLPCWIQS